MRVTPDGDRVVVSLDEDEAALVRELVRQMLLLLQSEADGAVMDRLFPDAYESADDERAYRELVGDSLQRQKLERLEAVQAALGTGGAAEAALDADVWLTVLTDMRLALGVRLDVDEARMAAEVDPADVNATALSVLHWLGWVQEEILQSLR